MRRLGMVLTIGAVAALLNTNCIAGDSAEISEIDAKQVGELMNGIPSMATKGTWPFDRGFARYDTLRRGGNGDVWGRWALTFDEACDGGAPYSSVPPEDKWKEPTQGASCPDSMLALLFESANTTANSDAIDYIELFCGGGGGCDGFAKTQRARNTHKSRAIKATFQWRSNSGTTKTRSYKLEPGGEITVSYCNCGAVSVTGARFVD